LRPAGLQVANRKQVEEQDKELRRLLSAGDAQQEQHGLCSGPQLGSSRGQQLCGVVLRCVGLRGVDLEHCSFTGHGSLCSLFVAAACTRVDIRESCFEGGGRGVEVQCVKETLLRDCSITDCLLEGLRCPHSQEIKQLHPELATDLQEFLECESVVSMCDCALSLLPGGGVVQCQGQLRLDDCHLHLCGSSPKLAAIAVSGTAVVTQIVQCFFEACPYAAISVHGNSCLAAVKSVRIVGCGLGIVLEGVLKEASGMADGSHAEEETRLKLKVLHPESRAEVLRRDTSLAESAWRCLETSSVVMQATDAEIFRCSGPALVLNQGSWLHACDLRMYENCRQPRHFWQVVDVVDKEGSFYWWQSTDATTAENHKMDPAIIKSAKEEQTCLTSSLPALVASAPVELRGPLLLPHLLLDSTPCCTDLRARQARLDAAHYDLLLEVLAKKKDLLLWDPQVMEAPTHGLKSEDGSSYTECTSVGNCCVGDAASSQSSQQEDSGAFHDLPQDELSGLSPEDLLALQGEDIAECSELLLQAAQQMSAHANNEDAHTAAQFRQLAESMMKARSRELGSSSST